MPQHDYQNSDYQRYISLSIYIHEVTENFGSSKTIQILISHATAEGNIQHMLSHQAIKKDIVFCLAENNRKPQIDW